MQSRRFRPGAPLSRFVQTIWYRHAEPEPLRFERLLPTGDSSIVFNLRGDPIRTYDAADLSRYTQSGIAVCCGARAKPFVIDTDQQQDVLGIQFHPGKLAAFLRVPMSALENLDVPLAAIWPGNTEALQDALLTARTPDEMFTHIEQALLALITGETHRAVDYAVSVFLANPALSVAQVCERTGLSARRFIELFHRQVGLTPKVFCRVQRFQKSLRMIQHNSGMDWAQKALECGYYDQSHMIHDFQALAGLTPRAYAELATPHLNHVPIPFPTQCFSARQISTIS